jgi:hypothetical protein
VKLNRTGKQYRVYILDAGDQVKIGLTNDLKNRQYTLETQSGRELTLAKYYEMGTDFKFASAFEYKLLAEFSKCRIEVHGSRTEWVKAPVEDICQVADRLWKYRWKFTRSCLDFYRMQLQRKKEMEEAV